MHWWCTKRVFHEVFTYIWDYIYLSLIRRRWRSLLEMIDMINGRMQSHGYALWSSFWRVEEGRVWRVMVDKIHAKAPIGSLNEREAPEKKTMDNIVAIAAKGRRVKRCHDWLWWGKGDGFECIYSTKKIYKKIIMRKAVTMIRCLFFNQKLTF